MSNEQNKRLAVNAALFAGVILVGTLAGWGGWLLTSKKPEKVAPVVEAPPPAPAAAQPAPMVAAVDPVPEVPTVPATAPAAEQVANLRQLLTTDPNATPQERRQALQQNLQDPAVQQQIRDTLANLQTQWQDPNQRQALQGQIQQLFGNRRGGGGGGQGFGGGGQGFGQPGGGNPGGAAPAVDPNADPAAGGQ